MDFFDRQEAARKSTKRLVFYFVLAVLGVALAVGAIASAALMMGEAKMGSSRGGVPSVARLWNPGIFLGVAGGTAVFILLGSLFKTMTLSAGGPTVAKALGGRKVDPNTTDADERKLLNVVEEMSIASGIPVPDVYLLEDEHGINAFAAGRTTSDAVVGMTRGCVKLLTRDELQGVVAHEFSHILNGDMRLNLRLMGLLFGILMITVFGRIILRSVFHSGAGHRRSSSRSGNNGGGVIAIAAFGVALLVVGYLGVLFANLIKAAVSRQREFLADASAVQFTRNPDGIAGALKKIGGLSAGSRIVNPHAEEASHMYFACGIKGSFANAMATHPPLDQRILAIDKSWNGRFPNVDLPDVSSSISSGSDEVEVAAAGIASLAGSAAENTGEAPRRAASTRPQRGGGQPDDIVSMFMTAAASASAVTADNIGDISGEQVGFATKLYASMPERWLAAAHNEAGAQALIFAMLLAQDDNLRGSELAMLQRDTDPAAYRTVMALHGDFGDLHSSQKIALIDLAIPSLRRLSPGEYDRFRALMRRLVESDGRVDLFEFMLEKIIRRHLDIAFNRTAAPRVRHKSFAPLADDAAVLVSTLAFLGVDSPEEGARSFAAGATDLESEIGGRLPLKPGEECGMARIDAALRNFEQAAAPLKRTLILACGKAVMHDGIIASDEAELLRAVADSIDAPIPPFVR